MPEMKFCFDSFASIPINGKMMWLSGLLLFMGLIIVKIDAQRIIVNTKLGEVEGVLEKSRAGRQYFSFYGIPYAEAPVNQLRFQVKLCIISLTVF